MYALSLTAAGPRAEELDIAIPCSRLVGYQLVGLSKGMYNL